MPENAVPLPDDLFDDLGRSGPVPMYHQVAERLERAIREGGVAGGARLENEVALAARLGLSRPTVRRAIQELVDKGLLVRRRGVGTQVVQASKVTREVALTSLYDDLERSGHRPTTELLDQVLAPLTAEQAAELGGARGETALTIRRLRSADGEPVAILENTLAPELADLDVEQLRRTGLYRALAARGVVMKVATQRIGARAATAHEAGLLDIPVGGPLLTIERIAFDHSGRGIELGRHAYRPDRHSFEVTLVER